MPTNVRWENPCFARVSDTFAETRCRCLGKIELDLAESGR